MSVEVRVAVAATADQVWSRWADLAGWPEWNPACAAASLDGDVAPGTRLRLQLVHPRGRAFLTTPTVSLVDPGRALVWQSRGFGFRVTTSTTLIAQGDETLVSLQCDTIGPLGFTYRLTFPEKTQGLLWSGALTALAQSFRDLTGARS